MKNIHVLPTDKPSRICKNKFGTFYLTESMESKISFFKNQNIYITNSEEIKEGDWFFEPINNSILKLKDKPDKLIKSIFPTCKKIILTTDADLVKDGVQAIPDEFLEWFVKNPSCDEVQVEWVDFSQTYFIKIPKEELKKEILEEDLDEIKNIRLWLKNKQDLCDKIIFKKYKKL